MIVFNRENETEGRIAEVMAEIDATGTYTFTKDELQNGAKMAWRNAPRCPGRMQWKNLDILDYR